MQLNVCILSFPRRYVISNSHMALAHCLIFLLLLQSTNSGELGPYFNSISCQSNSSMLFQTNEGIHPIYSGNSTIELRKTCENVDKACTCDSPQLMRCHNPNTGNLSNIIRAISSSPTLDIKMLDLNLPNIQIFTKKYFRRPNQKSKNSLKLVGLFVSSNGTLNTLEDGSFLGLRQDLQVLGLSDNHLGPELPQEIFSLPNLVRLDISKNRISSLRPILKHSTRSLNYLDLSGNDLERINNFNSSIFPDSLCTLRLSHNEITLDGLLKANLAQIGYLDLSNNKMSGNLTKYIFDGRGGKQVETLYLDSNYLSYIGENSFCGLPMLKYLRLSHNSIDQLDKNSFKCLKHVTYIDLSYNQILDITRGLFDPISDSLTNLILSNNHLSVLYSPITTVPLAKLTYLDLQNNEIIKIGGNTFEFLNSLTTLLLAG